MVGVAHPALRDVVEVVPQLGASDILISVGGLVGEMGIPRAEFARITKGLHCHRVFLRDDQRAAYHRADLSLGDLAECLREIVAELGPCRVVLVGNSMGGTAAILLGRMIEADVVLAFAPQTFYTRRLRLRYLDRRWPQLARAARAGAVDRSHLDLRQALSRTTATVPVHIYAAAGYRLDRAHAERLRELPGVHLHLRPGGDHSVVRGLRDSGELRPDDRGRARAAPQEPARADMLPARARTQRGMEPVPGPEGNVSVRLVASAVVGTTMPIRWSISSHTTGACVSSCASV